MTKRLLILSFAFIIQIHAMCFGQETVIYNLEQEDTLSIGLEYISSRYGHDTYQKFKLTRNNNNYFIQYVDDPSWYQLSNEQKTSLLEFEKDYLDPECYSESYVNVHVELNGRKELYQVCWDIGDKLIESLKRKDKGVNKG